MCESNSNIQDFSVPLNSSKCKHDLHFEKPEIEYNNGGIRSDEEKMEQ